MDILGFLLFIFLTIIIFFILRFLVRVISTRLVTIEEVKEGERAVIYRRGRFHRVLKPGWHLIWLPLDAIERRFTVRNEPRHYQISDIFAGGVPFGLTISAWTRFDPLRSWEEQRIDRDQLAERCLFSEFEWHRQAEWKIRETFINRLSEIEAELSIASGGGIEERLLPIFPGTPINKTLLRRMRDDLRETLPQLGVHLDPGQPLIIEQIDPPAELIDAFSLSRLFDVLDRVMPGLSSKDKMHISAAFMNWLGIKRDDLIIEGGGRDAPWVNVRRRGDQMETRIDVGSAPSAEHHTTPSEAQTTLPNENEGYEWLSNEDLAYLKRLPRGD